MRIFEIPIYVEVKGKKHIVFPQRVSWEGMKKTELDQGSYVFSAQNLLNPVPDAEKKFRVGWLRQWTRMQNQEFTLPKFLKIVICVDPANTTKKKSDHTAMSVHGWDDKQNWYLLDLYRDKLFLEDDRARKVIELHQKWQPMAQNYVPVLYETIGFQVSDKHNLERKQVELNYRFKIIEIKPTSPLLKIAWLPE